MEPRFQPSGLNSSFHAGGTDFAAHCCYMREMIANARIDLTATTRDYIVEANCPIEFTPKQPNNIGILCIHGLLASPYQYRDVGKRLAKEGYLVRNVCLPGHGTVPGDLLEVRLEDWKACLDFHLQLLKKKVDKVILFGYSTGGALAAWRSLERNDVDALVLMAPALAFNVPFGVMTNWHRAISWFYPPAKWFVRKGDNDYAKYESITFNGVHQLYRLMKQVKAKQNSLQVPLFLVMTDDDLVVSPKAMLSFYAKQNHAQNSGIVFANRELNLADGLVRVPSAEPDKNILSYPHHCLAAAPDNPHYGYGGDYKDFLHYTPQEQQRKARGPLHFGVENSKLLKLLYIARLCYNPKFDTMLASILDFIQRV